MAREINGYFTKDTTIKDKEKTLEFKAGDQVPMFKYLQDDGSTVSGCWIYCGSYTQEGNQMARRGASDPTGLGLFPKWSWAWPVNRRIIYNRASVNPAGEPFNPKRPVIAWDGLEKKWKGDVPDGPWPPMKDDKEGKYPFIMLPENRAAPKDMTCTTCRSWRDRPETWAADRAQRRHTLRDVCSATVPGPLVLSRQARS